jgi:ribokinase
MQKPIVVVGSINLDLVVGADRLPRIGETIIGQSFDTFYGGKGANQAVAIAKLGYPVSMVGNVGSDVFGEQLRAGLDVAGVDTTYVNRVEGASGVALITTGAVGENSIVVVPGANALLAPKQLENSATILKQAGFLLAQLEIPLETVEYLAQFAERHDIPLILDPAPARELSAGLLRRVTWITPNESEMQELVKIDLQSANQGARDAAERLLDCGAKNVLLKLGARGCLIAPGNLSQQLVPPFAVNAVDTTGAGDAFNAAFAVCLMRGLTVARSAVFASADAAISVTRSGAQASMPTFAEVQAFLNERLGPEAERFAIEATA